MCRQAAPPTTRAAARGACDAYAVLSAVMEPEYVLRRVCSRCSVSAF